MTRSRDVADTQDNAGGAVAPFVAGKNFQINGGFDIWQRGTTINNAAHSTYTADQWIMVSDSVGTVNVSQQNIAAQGLNSTYAMRVEKSAGASNRVVMVSVPEGALNCVGKTVTLSGYLRKGAGLTSNVVVDIGTRATRYGTQFDGATSLQISNSLLSTSTFTRFSTSFNVTTATSSNNANLFEVEILFNQAGGANVYLEFAAIQIEVGSVATPFSRAGGSIGNELALCQRYYQKFLGAGSGQVISGFGACVTSTIAQASIVFPVQMRTSAQSFDGYLPSWYNYGNNTTYSSGTFTMTDVTPSIVKIRYTHGSSVFTAGQGGEFVSAGGNGYLAFSAEL